MGWWEEDSPSWRQPLRKVPLLYCVLSFVDFLEDSKRSNSCVKIVLIGQTSATFDTPILLRTVQDYVPELLQRMNKLNVHFAKIKINSRGSNKQTVHLLKPIEEHLFVTDFQSHDALEDVHALKRILFKSSLHLSTSTIINKSATT